MLKVYQRRVLKFITSINLVNGTFLLPPTQTIFALYMNTTNLKILLPLFRVHTRPYVPPCLPYITWTKSDCRSYEMWWMVSQQHRAHLTLIITASISYHRHHHQRPSTESIKGLRPFDKTTYEHCGGSTPSASRRIHKTKGDKYIPPVHQCLSL